MEKWFYWKNNFLFLHIQLQTRARHDEIVGIHNDHLKIRIKAPAIEGRANDYVIKYLAQCFHVNLHQVTILRGLQSKIKLIQIDSPNDVSILNENYFRQQ